MDSILPVLIENILTRMSQLKIRKKKYVDKLLVSTLPTLPLFSSIDSQFAFVFYSSHAFPIEFPRTYCPHSSSSAQILPSSS